MGPRSEEGHQQYGIVSCPSAAIPKVREALKALPKRQLPKGEWAFNKFFREFRGAARGPFVCLYARDCGLGVYAARFFRGAYLSYPQGGGDLR